MLRFFSLIRRKLIEEDRIRTYIWYALGEIMLVMIGILLALQVNNWNEQRVEQKQLRQYLQAVANNVKSDLIQLQVDAADRDTLREVNSRAYEMFVKGEQDVELLKRAQMFFYEYYFTPNRSGYEALKSSGYIGKLTNTRTDSLLHNYYVGLDDLYEREVSFNTFIENVEYDYRTSFPGPRILYLMRKDTLNAGEEAELLESFNSLVFQAGVLRSSRQGTGLYYRLIEDGKELIRELESFIAE